MNRRVNMVWGFFVIGNIYITREGIQVVEECCQVCQELFFSDAMLETSDIGEGQGGTSKLAVDLRMYIGILWIDKAGELTADKELYNP